MLPSRKSSTVGHLRERWDDAFSYPEVRHRTNSAAKAPRALPNGQHPCKTQLKCQARTCTSEQNMAAFFDREGESPSIARFFLNGVITRHCLLLYPIYHPDAHISHVMVPQPPDGAHVRARLFATGVTMPSDRRSVACPHNSVRMPGGPGGFTCGCCHRNCTSGGFVVPMSTSPRTIAHRVCSCKLTCNPRSTGARASSAILPDIPQPSGSSCPPDFLFCGCRMHHPWSR